MAEPYTDPRKKLEAEFDHLFRSTSGAPPNIRSSSIFWLFTGSSVNITDLMWIGVGRSAC